VYKNWDLMCNDEMSYTLTEQEGQDRVATYKEMGSSDKLPVQK